MATSKRTMTQKMLAFMQGGSREAGVPPDAAPPAESSSAAAVGKPALDLRPQLMEQIVDRDNMERAWAKVRSNHGAPGIDGVSVDDFPDWLGPQWPAIRQSLLEGTYRPAAVRRVFLPKPDGSQRKLGIPTVLDRLIQQAVLQVLTPIFDPHFSESSFGFRPHRSAHGAVLQVKRFVQEGRNVAVDMDLSKFFDRVQHDVLMARVARRVTDRRVLRLIGRYLRAGVLADGATVPNEQGTPQGGPLSPLLANVLLDDFDKELERRGLRFARYADDFIILASSQRAGRRIKAWATQWLTRRLRLVINESKSRVDWIYRCDFLGFSFVGAKERVKIRVAKASVARFRQRIRHLTRRKRGVSLRRRLVETNDYLRGWMGYFRLAETPSVFEALDGWTRRRFRACVWKQWKQPRTRIRRLLGRGISREWAIRTGCSRKGPWRLTKSPAVQEAMPVEWFRQQGLFSLHDCWRERAPPMRTA